VLWSAVEQQHRCPVAHLGDMEPDPPTVASDIHPEVIDTRQSREPIESRRRGRNRHDDNLSPRHYGAKHPTLSHDRFHPFPLQESGRRLTASATPGSAGSPTRENLGHLPTSNNICPLDGRSGTCQCLLSSLSTGNTAHIAPARRLSYVAAFRLFEGGNPGLASR